MDRSLQYNNGMWSVPNLRPTRAETAASAYRGRPDRASSASSASSYGSPAGMRRFVGGSGRPGTTGGGGRGGGVGGRGRGGRYVSRESLYSRDSILGGGSPQLRPLANSISASSSSSSSFRRHDSSSSGRGSHNDRSINDADAVFGDDDDFLQDYDDDANDNDSMLGMRSTDSAFDDTRALEENARLRQRVRELLA